MTRRRHLQVGSSPVSATLAGSARVGAAQGRRGGGSGRRPRAGPHRQGCQPKEEEGLPAGTPHSSQRARAVAPGKEDAMACSTAPAARGGRNGRGGGKAAGGEGGGDEGAARQDSSCCPLPGTSAGPPLMRGPCPRMHPARTGRLGVDSLRTPYRRAGQSEFYLHRWPSGCIAGQAVGRVPPHNHAVAEPAHTGR